MNIKSIIKAAKLYNKSRILPILETAKLTGSEMSFSDLETEIVIPYASGITACVPISNLIAAWETFETPVYTLDVKENIRTVGETTHTDYERTVFISQGKQTIKMVTDDPENFPMERRATETTVGTITEAMMPTILEAMEFTSKDNLRPAIMCVQLADHIAATDAHRLMYVPLEKPFSKPVLLLTNVIKLMDIFGGDWSVTVSKEGNYLVTLENAERVRITYRAMDHMFPNWKLVVPEMDSHTAVATLDTKELRKAIKIGAKFGNKYTNLGTISLNGKAMYHTGDADFQMEYDTELTVDYSQEIEIGFNWKLLDGILDKCGDKAKMNYFTPKKAVIFEGKYLLMPLM